MTRVGRRRETVVVAGALARRPSAGGHAWVFLQYLLGLRRLGFDVLFVDWLEQEDAVAASWLRSVLEPYDVPFSLLLRGGTDVIAGQPRDEVLRRLRSSAFLLDANGYLGGEELLAAAPRRVFLDIDPGFLQMWCELGLADPFAGYDVFATVGGNVGSSDCGVPTCGLEWIPTPQPVVLDEWPVRPATDGAFTTVAAWRGPFGPIDYRGRTYGLRVHEFRKFAPLPRVSGARFELALDIDPAETSDLALLRENGWRLADPREVAGDTTAYASWIARSKAELMVAKNLYVETRSGWFSDRSLCYLASGKPVLAQDTGFRDLYPTGEGIVAFSTLDEAVAGVEAIEADYERHSRAARELAAEFFDSDKVLARLVEKVGAA
jgi:hypothetical protein